MEIDLELIEEINVAFDELRDAAHVAVAGAMALDIVLRKVEAVESRWNEWEASQETKETE